MQNDKPSEDDGDVFIVEAISVSVSDRNLPTHGAPTVDAAAFGVEAQPRLPLFHDDPDYYEVDLGDDDFLVVEAGGRAIGGHDACSLDKDEGSGDAQVESFYYGGGGECHKFTYKGEGGNDNRFDSEAACLSRCDTREVSPGCFSSPPRDCGAGCVASFREDRGGCYECCCQEKQVNATACALPADGGKCRGFIEQWAFNEATGDCEKFTYGGCGGNDNRFNCKEMCMRNCGNP